MDHLCVISQDEVEQIRFHRGIPQVKGVSNSEVAQKYPILFRGCHLAELSPDILLSQIQGRPEDTSYNGNVIHFTHDLPLAIRYCLTNASRPFPDTTTIVTMYNANILAEYGTFGPDLVDSSESNTAIQSLQQCKQVRWYNHHIDGQRQRLSALIGIYSIPRPTSLHINIHGISTFQHLNIEYYCYFELLDGHVYYEYLSSFDRTTLSTQNKSYKQGDRIMIYGLVHEFNSDVGIVFCDKMKSSIKSRIGNGSYVQPLNCRHIGI